ncbi:MAG: hypothetical protein ACTSWY_13170 [Promethearchaeota archaeon]
MSMFHKYYFLIVVFPTRQARLSRDIRDDAIFSCEYFQECASHTEFDTSYSSIYCSTR